MLFFKNLGNNSQNECIVDFYIVNSYDKQEKRTFTDCGGAGVIVTDGVKSLIPGGKFEGGLPIELLCGGCGTERLALLTNGEVFREGPWIVLLPRIGGGCC